uniref:GTP-binding-protein n=1 Tax=Schistosoma japonicum TaxID=6182 RepID=C1L5U7_SCHJA|nr:GTP-binding-protein [Schistosoma japonicum]
MGFGLVAIAYILALIFTIALIFLVIFQVISFDELRTDYKNPVDQCKSLNPLVLPEYALHAAYTLLFLFTAQIGSVMLNVPLLAYNIYRSVLICIFYLFQVQESSYYVLSRTV